jgi:hypothetical protein
VISDALALAMADKLKHYLPDFPLSYLQVSETELFFTMQPAMSKPETNISIRAVRHGTGGTFCLETDDHESATIDSGNCRNWR